jgi:hypothetical protein
LIFAVDDHGGPSEPRLEGAFTDGNAVGGSGAVKLDGHLVWTGVHGSQGGITLDGWFQ